MYHDLAILNDSVHYLMHTSSLFTSLVFVWRVLDRRPAPRGTPYGVRLIMLRVMNLSNIVIGSYLAFKGSFLHSAYAQLGRLWNLSALGDELLRGALIWIPSIMLRRRGYGHNELPMAATELIQGATRKNRTMAFGFAGFVTAVFVGAIAVGVVNQIKRS